MREDILLNELIRQALWERVAGHKPRLVVWECIRRRAEIGMKHNAEALEFDPLSDEHMRQIDELAGQYHSITM